MGFGISPNRISRGAGASSRGSGGSVGTGAWKMGAFVPSAPPPPSPDVAAFLRAIDPNRQGGGSRGGGGGFAALPAMAAPTPIDPTQDPAYQAYMAALDREQGSLDPERKLRTEQLAIERDRQLGDIKMQYENPGGIMDRLRGDFEARGSIRSGAYGSAQQHHRDIRATQEGSMGAAYQSGVDSLERELAQRLADIQARRNDTLLRFSTGG